MRFQIGDEIKMREQYYPRSWGKCTGTVVGFKTDVNKGFYFRTSKGTILYTDDHKYWELEQDKGKKSNVWVK